MLTNSQHWPLYLLVQNLEDLDPKDCLIKISTLIFLLYPNSWSLYLVIKLNTKDPIGSLKVFSIPSIGKTLWTSIFVLLIWNSIIWFWLHFTNLVMASILVVASKAIYGYKVNSIHVNTKIPIVTPKIIWTISNLKVISGIFQCIRNHQKNG